MTSDLRLHHFLGQCREIARAQLGEAYAVARLRDALAEYDHPSPERLGDYPRWFAAMSDADIEAELANINISGAMR